MADAKKIPTSKNALDNLTVTKCKNCFILITTENIDQKMKMIGNEFEHESAVKRRFRLEKSCNSRATSTNFRVHLPAPFFCLNIAIAIALPAYSILCLPAYGKEGQKKNAVNQVEERTGYLKELIGAESLSFFGVTMEDAMSSHFIERFNFRQFAFSVTDDGFTEILLRLPRLKPGRPFVTLIFALDQSGKIVRSSLRIKRRYIEDKIHGAFARDYAKSFVQGAVSFKSLAQVDSIANEIFYRPATHRMNTKASSTPSSSDDLTAGDIFITGLGGKFPIPPDLPKRTSMMYRCFIGRVKVSKLKLSDAVLQFSNENQDGEETLVINVEANGFEHSDENRNVDFENLPMHVPTP